MRSPGPFDTDTTRRRYHPNPSPVRVGQQTARVNAEIFAECPLTHAAHPLSPSSSSPTFRPSSRRYTQRVAGARSRSVVPCIAQSLFSPWRRPSRVCHVGSPLQHLRQSRSPPHRVTGARARTRPGSTLMPPKSELTAWFCRQYVLCLMLARADRHPLLPSHQSPPTFLTPYLAMSPGAL